MHVVLWNTRKLDASKDFAGGFGVGQYPGHGGLRGRVIRRFFKRDRRPVPLVLAHLAAVFRQLGHEVEYVEDRRAPDADLYVFCPSLITLDLERRTIAALLARRPAARILVVGLAASVMPEAFSDLDVTIVRGEAEQLLWKLDEVLSRPAAAVQLGTIEDLDNIPLPDWSPFRPDRFSVGYDFWRFPTALIQASRGCTFRCSYCPYIIQENSVRFRDPESVVEEIRRGVSLWGFRSFKFRDPLFGLSRAQVYRLAELIGRLPYPIQFSIETRMELMRPELLRVLKRVGLSAITVGVETPSSETLRHYRRLPPSDDRQQEFFNACRELGIRTIAGFMLGFPEDTEQSIRGVMKHAIALRPTFANFNIVTPYPGTEFFEEIKQQIDDFNFSRYTVYTPVLKYQHLTAAEVERLHAKCFHRFYFRWQYLLDNAHLLWPTLGKLGLNYLARRRNRPVSDVADASDEPGALDEPGAESSPQQERRDVLHPAGEHPAAASPHPRVPQPLSGLELLRRRGLRQDRPHRRGGVADP
jgi:anaerobic magnesium-protoporphyrin IX monomethyl ester cyclase